VKLPNQVQKRPGRTVEVASLARRSEGPARRKGSTVAFYDLGGLSDSIDEQSGDKARVGH